ncbi:MAG: ABC transporter permease [Erysipelothrix sp.]|nr:ABC transporter permease [Erysipelothrix sp.]
MTFIDSTFPNLIIYWNEFLKAISQTVYMMFISGFFGILFGLILGIAIVVTKKDGLLENGKVYHFLDKFTNLFRSIPFVILIPVLMPLTRAIMGTAIGVKGALLPLVIGVIPFFMRQVAMALGDVNPGLIEAATAMGLTPIGIIIRVYLKESLPSLIRAISITLISLLGLSTMAGSIGGGGIGDFVIRYGHARYFYDITFVSVILILLMVSLIEAFGNLLIKKVSH